MCVVSTSYSRPGTIFDVLINGVLPLLQHVLIKIYRSRERAPVINRARSRTHVNPHRRHLKPDSAFATTKTSAKEKLNGAQNVGRAAGRARSLRPHLKLRLIRRSFFISQGAPGSLFNFLESWLNDVVTSAVSSTRTWRAENDGGGGSEPAVSLRKKRRVFLLILTNNHSFQLKFNQARRERRQLYSFGRRRRPFPALAPLPSLPRAKRGGPFLFVLTSDKEFALFPPSRAGEGRLLKSTPLRAAEGAPVNF